VVDSSTASTFDGHVQGAIVGPSVLKLTYTVRVTDVDALDDALQAAFDARNGAPGNYETTLKNTATFGGDTEADAEVRLRGTILGPCPGCTGDFAKRGDLTTVNALTQDDGTLLEPVDIAYTLRANLGQWDGHSSNFTLNDNVVIEDTLISQASWNTGTGFLTVSGAGPIASLDAVACPTPASDFAGDTFVGKYCLDGQKLLVNVGKNSATNITITAHAQLNTVAGLPTVDGVEGGDRYRVRNTATFRWGGSNFTTPNVDGYVVVPESSAEGVDDSSAFAKTAPDRLSAVPGQPLEVPYTFTADSARTGVPAASTKIVDYVDTRYFDLAPGLSNVTVSGDYKVGSTTTPLAATDFTLTRVGDSIEIVLSTAGKAKAAAPNGVLTVKLTLTTLAFDGKETIDIRNRAALFGSGGDPLFVSQFESQGRSYGAESETRKHVFDRVTNGGEWTQLLVPGEEEIGEVYVYRLQFIGHPGFGGIAIDPEQDVLPAGLEFLGFVNEADKATGANPAPGPVDTDEGNLVATFVNSAPSGTIQLTQRPGTTFEDGSIANVYFAARIVDEDLAIINDFGNSRTIIVPGGPSIDIEKWIDEGSAPEYDQQGRLTNDGFTGDYDKAPGKSLTADQKHQIRFTVSNDGPEPLIDIEVSDSLDSGVGPITGLDCIFPDDSTGTTWAGPLAPAQKFECTGTLPALKAGQRHADTVQVNAVGAMSGVPVHDDDEWHGHVPTALETTGGQALSGLAVLVWASSAAACS